MPGRVASQHCPLVFGRKLTLCCAAAGGSRLVVLVGVNDGLDRFAAGVVAPVGLHEHGVDLLEVDGSGMVAHGLDERAGAEVSSGPQDALGDAQDEVECVVGEGVVGQAAEVELGVDARCAWCG